MHLGMARRSSHLGRARDNPLKWVVFPWEDTNGWMCIMEAITGKWKKPEADGHPEEAPMVTCAPVLGSV